MSGRQRNGRNWVSVWIAANIQPRPTGWHITRCLLRRNMQGLYITANTLHHPPAVCICQSQTGLLFPSSPPRWFSGRAGSSHNLQISPIFWTGEWWLTSTGFSIKEKQHHRGENTSSYLTDSVLAVAIKISKVAPVCLLLNSKKTLVLLVMSNTGLNIVSNDVAQLYI